MLLLLFCMIMAVCSSYILYRAFSA
jgi:hypothetical protein